MQGCDQIAALLRFRPMTDHRSPEAQAYRHLYRSSAWRKGRLIFLAQHPLCERCKAKGRITAATVVNHIKPHKGDITLFFAWSNFEATCKPCHDRDIQSEERIGYSKAIGIDGWPTDNRHPANR
jgi:5-methylcytosine-specific restriction endonuclease McrA